MCLEVPGHAEVPDATHGQKADSVFVYLLHPTRRMDLQLNPGSNPSTPMHTSAASISSEHPESATSNTTTALPATLFSQPP
ncbi:hypothetical protein P7K49_005429 [Saguinus oedipus]|uniref:Uncharacterized protein n=1 Tax=Saguinus oedipus TaxID=9490 RepID=A0ABQ9WA97_SAGOE|nr:hypothetical protein P7K49_005429 [Saguinus oedipus]